MADRQLGGRRVNPPSGESAGELKWAEPGSAPCGEERPVPAGRAGQSARIPPDAAGESGWASRMSIPACPNAYPGSVSVRPTRYGRGSGPTGRWRCRRPAPVDVPCAGRAPGPDRLAVRRCLPDCRKAGYRQGRTLTPGRGSPGPGSQGPHTRARRCRTRRLRKA